MLIEWKFQKHITSIESIVYLSKEYLGASRQVWGLMWHLVKKEIGEHKTKEDKFIKHSHE